MVIQICVSAIAWLDKHHDACAMHDCAAVFEDDSEGWCDPGLVLCCEALCW